MSGTGSPRGQKGALKMDSSTKATNEILGKVKTYNIKELEAKDRLKIIEKILFLYGSYLKYATSEFKSINDLLDITDECSISSKGKVDLRTFYISFGGIKDPDSQAKTALLLSRKEKWVVCSFISASKYHFTPLGRNRFMKILRVNDDLLLWTFFIRLAAIAKESAKKKRKSAKKMESMVSGITRIHSRIKF